MDLLPEIQCVISAFNVYYMEKMSEIRKVRRQYEFIRNLVRMKVNLPNEL